MTVDGAGTRGAATPHPTGALMARIGISGWRYAGWRGHFYPPGLPQRLELGFVGERLTSVEVNGSFYSLQRPSSWRSWAEQVPEDFVLSVKGPRFVTHMKKLNDVETPLATFLASGVLSLGDRLGPVLWQLPPNLGFHPDRLAAFFDLLPRTTAAASSYAAAHHDADKLKEPADTSTPVDRPLHHVLEVRHASFRTAGFCELLRAHDIGMVVADSELYASGYSDAALDHWADKVRAWEADGLDVFVYFDNDAKVHAPFDALALQERLGISPPADEHHAGSSDREHRR